MLIQFTVSNFLSIKDKITFSMLAGKEKSHNNCILTFGKERLLSSAAVYGANAAGKSNLFKAFTASIIIIRTSNNRQINEKIPSIIPFLFDKDSSSKPTSFDFIFTNNGRKYEYGFTADENKIYDEYLNEYKTAKPSRIFERKNSTEYYFTKADEKEFDSYKEKTTNNKLFLSTATAWNCLKTKDAYMWFAEKIDTYNRQGLEGFGMNQLENEQENKLKPFLLKMLNKADLSITDYNFKSEELSKKDFSKLQLPPGLQLSDSLMGSLKSFEITTAHMVETSGVKKQYTLPFELESEGTKRMFYLSTVFKQALELGKTIIIDEMDDSLHPLLIKSIIELFNDNTVNSNNSQLIFNTHDVSVLSLDTFRRDQIYFVDKNDQTAITDLYSLDEFSPRKNENVRKKYLQGRFGAIPNIESEGLR